MPEDVKPITANKSSKEISNENLQRIRAAWPYLTYWERKQLVGLMRWYLFKSRLRKYHTKLAVLWLAWQCSHPITKWRQ
jgi:hypothetical protein